MENKPKYMNNTEVWKDVLGYEGIYQVSNLGNVKSLERIVPRENGGDFIVREKFLKVAIDNVGYYKLCLYKEAKRKNMRIHVLVAQAFLGHVPDGYKIVVDHINNNPLDNRIENLQLISQRQNAEKAYLNKKTSSKYTGVSWHKQYNKWISRIRIDGKLKHLGYFTDEYEAHVAYRNALKELL